jgi:transposase
MVNIQHFLAKSKDGDHHQEMNSVVFLEWFENQLMPAMNNPSLVVLDNASYHNIKRASDPSFGNHI